MRRKRCEEVSDSSQRERNKVISGNIIGKRKKGTKQEREKKEQNRKEKRRNKIRKKKRGTK